MQEAWSSCEWLSELSFGDQSFVVDILGRLTAKLQKVEETVAIRSARDYADMLQEPPRALQQR